MTAADDVRGRLRRAGAAIPLAQGSLGDVQARAARLRRRNSAVRGAAGACALAAVAAVGVAALRTGSAGDYSTTADALAATDAVPEFDAASASDAGAASDDVAETAAGAASDAGADEASERAESEEQLAPPSPDASLSATADTAMGSASGGADDADDTVLAPQDVAYDHRSASDSRAESAWEFGTGSGTRWDAESAGGSPYAQSHRDTHPAERPPWNRPGDGAVFASTLAVVAPPPEAEGADMRYSFSGAHAVARTADAWYSYDGTGWRSVGMPENIEVVAVDLSSPHRIAVLGIVRPAECVVEQVVAVYSGGRWGYVRVDDGTPPTLSRELLDAHIHVTDSRISVERAEVFRLREECAVTDGRAQAGREPDAATATLLVEVAAHGEVRRESWLSASFVGGFASHWPSVARPSAAGAVAAVAPDNSLQGDAGSGGAGSGDRGSAEADSSDRGSGEAGRGKAGASEAGSGAKGATEGGLTWTATTPARFTINALKLTPSRAVGDGGQAATVALHETMMMDVATSVHVSDGMAMLQHGEQVWEICPIHDTHEAHGEIGWAGKHLAVVVGKPEQTLFVAMRAG